MMRIVPTINGSLRTILAAAGDEIADDFRAAVETASTRLQADLRSQVRAAGLGVRLEKAWQKEIYPRSRSRRTFHPAGLVYSKSTVLHDAFDAGPTIVGRQSRFLVVPSPAGEKLGLGTVNTSRKGGVVPGGQNRRYADLDRFADRIGAEITSVGAPRGGRSTRRRNAGAGARIVIVPAQTGNLVALLYSRPGARPVMIATLMPMVKLRKRLDIAGAQARAEGVLIGALSGSSHGA